jgi:tellurium resistance protein TerD
MAISLQKGGNVSLSKQVPGLKRVRFGLGWDLRKTDGSAFDLDASAFVLNADGKVLSDQHFVFYNNPKDPSEARLPIKGDNRTGEGARATMRSSRLPWMRWKPIRLKWRL